MMLKIDVDNFVHDYYVLCRKYRLMIQSLGLDSELGVVPFDDRILAFIATGSNYCIESVFISNPYFLESDR